MKQPNRPFRFISSNPPPRLTALKGKNPFTEGYNAVRSGVKDKKGFFPFSFCVR
jgi:hypothetical protein